MSTTQPIRSKQLLHDFKDYYLTKQPNSRNYTLILIGLNTALRINDILHLTWGDVYCTGHSRFYTHLLITEKKRKRNQNPDQQRTSENITVLPDNTAFHSRHRLPLPQPQKNRFPTLPIPGLPHCP